MPELDKFTCSIKELDLKILQAHAWLADNRSTIRRRIQTDVLRELLQKTSCPDSKILTDEELEVIRKLVHL